MTGPCPFPCTNKTEFGYCKTTACIYAPTIRVTAVPQTDADRIISKTPEEPAGMIEKGSRCMILTETIIPIKRYCKKPVVIEAMQLNNINAPSAVRWIGEDKAKMNLESDAAYQAGKAPPVFSVTIQTLEGDMKAMPGDYIIKGVHGEFYPCKPSIFEETYEVVEPPKEET